MAKKQSSQELMARAKANQKLVDSGKLSGAKLKQAKIRAAFFRWKAKKVKAEGRKKRLKTFIKRPAKHQIVKGQGFLPNFLIQMDMVKIEELISQKVFSSLAEGNLHGVVNLSDLLKEVVKEEVHGALLKIKPKVDEAEPEIVFASDRKKKKAL